MAEVSRANSAIAEGQLRVLNMKTCLSRSPLSLSSFSRCIYAVQAFSSELFSFSRVCARRGSFIERLRLSQESLLMQLLSEEEEFMVLMDMLSLKWHP